MAQQLLETSIPYKNIREMVPLAEVSTVYVDEISNISQKESVMYQNDRRITFNNISSNAVNVFTFDSSEQFLGQMWVEFKLDKGAVTKFHNFRSDYPAYDLIKKISWKIGSTSEYQIPKEVLLDFLHEQCETESKKRKLHELAGYKLMARGLDDFKLCVFLPLPWSTLKSNKIGNNQRPFPSHALGNQKITLRIELEDYTKVVADITDPNQAISVSNIDLCYKFAKVATNGELYRGTLHYPFKQAIGGESITLTNNTTSHAANLKGFQSGELNQIIFHVQAPSGGDPFGGIAVHDIEVKVKGTTFYKANGRNSMIDLLEEDELNSYGEKLLSFEIAANKTVSIAEGYSGIKIGTILAAGEMNVELYGHNILAANANKESRQFYYAIPVSEIRLKMLESFNQYEIGSNFENEDIRLEFKTVENTANKILQVCHVYNGVYELTQDGGNSIVKCAL